MLNVTEKNVLTHLILELLEKLGKCQSNVQGVNGMEPLKLFQRNNFKEIKKKKITNVKI